MLQSRLDLRVLDPPARRDLPLGLVDRPLQLRLSRRSPHFGECLYGKKHRDFSALGCQDHRTPGFSSPPYDTFGVGREVGDGSMVVSREIQQARFLHRPEPTMLFGRETRP